MVPQPTWCIRFWTVPTDRLPLIISGIVECPTGRQFGSKAAERSSGDSVPELQSGRLSRYPDPVQQPHYSATGTRPGDRIPPLLSVCSPFRLDESCFSTHFNVFVFFFILPTERPNFSQAALQLPVCRNPWGDGKRQSEGKLKNQRRATLEPEHHSEQEYALFPAVCSLCAGMSREMKNTPTKLEKVHTRGCRYTKYNNPPVSLYLEFTNSM